MSYHPLPGRQRVDLSDGWELAGTPPDTCETPASIDRLAWRPARVPGTAAGAWDDPDADFDAHDWWFRVSFSAPPAAREEEVVLHLDGLATIGEVFLNGQPVLASESMFAEHELDIGARLRGANELAICCRALAPRLKGRRKPRARWRTGLVSAANLRFYRTMLIGRAPGFSPGPAVVGPWAPVWLERRRGVLLDAVRLRARLRGDAGVLCCTGTLRALPGSKLPTSLVLSLVGAAGHHEAELPVLEAREEGAPTGGQAIVPEPARWWPHTHGTPALYGVAVDDADGSGPLHAGRVGFRTLESAPDLAADGPALRINGEPVFVRGAVWTPPSLLTPLSTPANTGRILDAVVAAGMNMLRVPGTALYESQAFHDICDALGILVWQDFMFANLDYPESDPAFMALVEREARMLLDRLGHRPSLAVLCGGSEVAQQVAMLGLDPALADGPLYGELLPRVVAEAEVDAPYLPSSPWGGELPFRTDRGVAHYYGVGAYRRPLEDARRAEVRFSSESLAFANVPDASALAELSGSGPAVFGPAWKSGVPRDPGAGWDFDDVRDHYLQTLFELDPAALRSSDPERYLELSRAVTGEVMAETFGEWRREGSQSRGALVLWLKDLQPGAGWGVLDHRGEPKVAYHHLRRALAPVAVWTTDEGLGGVAIHVANDRGEPLATGLRVALYRDFEQRTDEATIELRVAPHSTFQGNVETLLGRFVDVSWAYRFGPPGQDLIAVSLEHDSTLISQAFRFPVGRPLAAAPLAAVGLAGRLRRAGRGAGPGATLNISTRRFAYGVRVQVPGFTAPDDAFGVEPGHERVLELQAAEDSEWPPATATLTAVNVAGGARIEVEG
ncbi:MAG: glycoside hydrolase family 2 protein [Solirubrobacteraceae bacterium]